MASNKKSKNSAQLAHGAPRFILTCTNCRARLSRNVALLRSTDPGITPPRLLEKRHVVAEGRAFISDMPFRQSYGDLKEMLAVMPQIWMTLRDILPSVQHTPDMHRLKGCCGLDGCDGPNRICTCGTHVGTEISDCWTPHLFIPEPDATNWHPAP